MPSSLFTSRPFAGADDLYRIAELVRAFPVDQVNVVDLSYRLSSPSLNAEHARVWIDHAGALVGFGIVQQPWQTLDYAVHPSAHDADVEAQIIDWAIGRAAVLAAARGYVYRLNVYVPAHSHARMAALAQHGFARDDTWSLLHLAQSPIAAPAREPLPPGFTVRPLGGSAEVAAYVALHRAAFDTTNMTVAWRQRTLAMPEYVVDLDLVVAAPDGQLAAFCICWLHPDGSTGQIEPLGVHPAFQQLGLGRGILSAALGRLRARGATTALVDAYADNDPARHLYESVGFRAIQTLITYAQEVV